MTNFNPYQKVMVGEVMSVCDADEILNVLLESPPDILIIDPLVGSEPQHLDFVRVVEPQLSENLFSVQSSEVPKLYGLAGPLSRLPHWNNRRRS